MITKEEIDAVLAAHAAWKARFRNFLAGKTGMDIATLGDTEHCAFGSWLDSYGAKLLKKEQFEEIGALHAEFHKVAGDIVSRLKGRDYDGAHAAVAAGGSLEQASGALAARLLTLKSTL